MMQYSLLVGLLVVFLSITIGGLGLELREMLQLIESQLPAFDVLVEK